MKMNLLHLDAHHRIAIGVCVALIAAIVPGGTTSVTAEILKVWIAFAGVMVAMIAAVVLLADPAEVRASAKLQDGGRAVILSLVLLAASGSLFFVAALFREAKAGPAGSFAVIAVSAVVLSWCLIHALFALHYAHIYFGDRGVAGPQHAGLSFPGGKPPDYLDFLYFSAVIGMTSQVSDVAVTSRRLRRLVLLHGVVSFFFNTVVLALTINLIASGGLS